MTQSVLDSFADILDVPATDDSAPPPDDTPPPPDDDSSAGGGDDDKRPHCEECGTVIPWSGRGRRPKRCADHKLRRSTNPRSISTRSNTKRAVKLDQLEGDITRELGIAGMGLAKVMPTAGITLFSRAEKTAQALVRIAQDNPRLMEALEIGAKVAPAFDLGETAAAVGVAILIDTGRVDPDSVISQMTGVSQLWHQTHDDEPEGASPNVPHVGMPVQNVPPRFETIAA